MTKIVEIRERTASLAAGMQNAYISFAEMTVSLVALITDQKRDGRPVIGYGFHSNGRYAQGGILRERLIPRVLKAPPSAYQDDVGNIDPIKLSEICFAGEKPGGHGDRAVAAAALDMAAWDAAAKIAEMPLWRLLSARFNDGAFDTQVMVYPGGGYYSASKSLQALQDEMRGYLDAGYSVVKMKIGGADLRKDMKRVKAVVDVVGDTRRVAVDANGRFELPQALIYADALADGDFFWFEEPLDPLDFQSHAALAEYYSAPLATGENLFSHADVRNLLRHGGLRSHCDWLQIDPALAYGVREYLHIIAEMETRGWSRRRLIPHGGHQFGLNIAAGLQLGGCESYSGVLQPYGGFAADTPVENGKIKLPEAPGIGVELRPEMFAEMRRVLELED